MKWWILGLLALPMAALSAQLQIPLQVKPLSNLNQTQSIVVSYLQNNQSFVEGLYSTLQIVNKKNPAHPIDLVINVTQNNNADFSNWYKKLAKKLKSKTPENLYVTYDQGPQNPWLQDIGEVMGFKVAGTERYVPGFLDTNYDGSAKSSSAAQTIFTALKIPIVNAQNYKELAGPNDGDRGGNIEATPEGRFFVGNTISAKLLTKLESLSGKKAHVMDTSFLTVGHIDEIYSFVPAQDRCGYALLHADGLAVINLAWQNSKKLKKDVGFADHVDSIAYFLKSTSKSKTTLTLEDFNLTRSIRIETDGSNMPNYGDYVILKNLKIYATMMKDIARLKTEMKCLETIVGIPTVLEQAGEFEAEDITLDTPRAITAYGTPMNHVVLGKDILIPKPYMLDEVKKSLLKVFNPENIHILNVDMSAYVLNFGSAHCATQIIRTP